jgi:hypothetical protein
MNIINRNNHLFVIDITQLNAKGKKIQNKNALYAAIYDEFFGASENKKYKNLTNLDRFNKLNEFATEWLKEMGFLNEGS